MSGGPIIGLRVSYVGMRPEAGFERFGKTSAPAYLWYKRGSAEDDRPLTNVQVLDEDKRPDQAECWVRIDANLNQSGDTPVHIWYSTHPSGGKKEGELVSPIINLALLFSNDPVLQPGFRKVDQPLNPNVKSGVVQEYLTFLTQAENERILSADYAVDEKLDALDTANNWLVARVVERNDSRDEQLLIHFEGWADKWDTWVSRSSERIAPHRSETRGKKTGWKDDISKDLDKSGFLSVSSRLRELCGKIFAQKETEACAAGEEKMSDSEAFQVSRDWGISERELAFIRDQQNKQYVQHVLDVVIDDPGIQKEVQIFLQRNLKLIKHRLDHPYPLHKAWLETLRLIFSGATTFYRKYGILSNHSKEDQDTNHEDKKSFAIQQTGARKPISSFLLANLDCWGQCGGFAAIQARLQNTAAAPSAGDKFMSTMLLVSVVETLAPFVRPTILVPFIMEQLHLKELSKVLIDSISDTELKALDPDALRAMVEAVNRVHTTTDPNDSRDTFLEYSRLRICLRLLKSKILSLKVQGVTELQEISSLLQPNSSRLSHLNRSHRQFHFLSPEILVKWIQEMDVVTLLLGSSSHEQIIKRSPGILKFLAASNALTVGHINLLWKAGLGKHEELVRIVYATLADLSQELGEAHLDVLFERLKEKKLSEYCDFDIEFVANFTVNAVRATKNQGKLFGLDMLWSAIQDEGDCSETMSALAMTTLQGLLKLPLFKSQRLPYLDQCVFCVRKGKSQVQALELARFLISLYPQKVQQIDSLSARDVIDALEELRSLLPLLIADAQLYHSQARIAAQKITSRGSDIEANPLLVGRHSHGKQLSTRLSFLNFAISSSSVHLEKTHLVKLWNIFVSQAVLPSDQSKLLVWLSSAVDKEAGYGCLNEHAIEFVFHDLMCSPSQVSQTGGYQGISEQGYACFEQYFKHVNKASGALATCRKDVWVVANFSKLTGLDALWSIVAESNIGCVQGRAAQLLALCFIRQAAKVSTAQKQDIFLQFLDRVMSMLASAKAGGKQRTPTVQRLLGLVKSFLDKCDQGEIIPEPRFIVGEKCNLLWNSHGRLNKYEVEVSKIHMDGWFDVVWMTNDNKRGGQQAHPETLQKLGQPMSRDEPLKHYPCTVLANQGNYLEVLLNLLDQLEELPLIEKEVWDLLQRLPMNEQLTLAIRTLSFGQGESKKSEGINAKHLFPPHSAARLLYNLQIVHKTLKQEVAGALWKRRFLERGGWEHCIQLLESKGAEWVSKSTLTGRALEMLLGLIKSLSDTADLAGGEGSERHSSQMIQSSGRLCSLVFPLLPVVVESTVSYTGFMPEGGAKAGSAAAAVKIKARRVLGMTNESLDPSLLAAREDADDNGKAKVQAALFKACSLVLCHCFSLNSKELSHLVPLDDSSQSEIRQRWKTVVTKGLLVSPNSLLKEQVSVLLLKFAKGLPQGNSNVSSANPARYFLNILIGIWRSRWEGVLDYTSLKKDRIHSSHFDAVLVQLLDIASRELQVAGGDIEGGGLGFDPLEFGLNLCKIIKALPILELRPTDVDHSLVGLYRLARELIMRVPSLAPQLGQAGNGKGNLVPILFSHLFQVRLRKLPPLEKAMQEENSRAQTEHEEENSAFPPKAKSQNSRKMAFLLLQSLIRDDDANMKWLLTHLLPLLFASHSAGKNANNWHFQTKNEEKSQEGYAGLKNLGSICYMNAELQQLFMIPHIRKGLLAVQAYKEQDLSKSVVYQLQHIMAALQETEKQACDPTGFCGSFKDPDGNPVNVKIQEDSGSFLSRLIDCVDEGLKGTPQEKLLRESVGGMLAVSKIGKGTCKHYAEKEEEFYSVNVEVRNKKDLQESLNSYVQGETMEGVICEQCGSKVTTLKRSCFKDMPSTMIFVLKRFDMDWATMRTIKINDKLEFPVQLDMRPYTKEGLRQREGFDTFQDGKPVVFQPNHHYLYNLRGMVIHTGGADRGHYYSFIKERVEDGGNEGRWMEFNDNLVRPFDLKDLAEECFGGVETSDGQQFYGLEAQEKAKSAYILFYDRAKPNEASQKSNVSARLPEPGAEHQKAGPRKAGKGPSKFPVPLSMLESVWDANKTHVRDKNVFDSAFFEFFWYNLFKQLEQPGSRVQENSKTFLLSAKAATYFVFNTLARSLQKPNLVQWLLLLCRCYSGKKSLGKWLLAQFIPEKTTWLNDILLDCPLEDVRKHGANLLCTAIRAAVLDEKERECLLEPLPKGFEALMNGEEGKQEESSSFAGLGASSAGREDLPTLAPLLRRMLLMLRTTPSRWVTFEPFWKVLAEAAKVGAAPMFHKAQVATRIIDILLSRKPLLSNTMHIPFLFSRVFSICRLWAIVVNSFGVVLSSKGSRGPLRDSRKSAQTSGILQLLAILSRSVLPDHLPADAPTPPTLLSSPSSPSASQMAVPPMMPSQLASLLLNPSFLSYLLQQALSKSKVASVSDILGHLCWESETVSQTVVGNAGSGLEESHGVTEFMLPYFRALIELAKLSDSLQKKRVEWIMESIFSCMELQARNYDCKTSCIDHLLRMAKMCKVCYAWLHASNRIDDLLAWLTQASPSYSVYEVTRDISRREIELRRIKDGEDLSVELSTDDEIDLESRIFSVGARVDYRVADLWRQGLVVQVSGNQMLVKIEDAEGEQPEKWIHMSDECIVEGGRFTRDHRFRSLFQEEGEFFAPAPTVDDNSSEEELS